MPLLVTHRNTQSVAALDHQKLFLTTAAAALFGDHPQHQQPINFTMSKYRSPFLNGNSNQEESYDKQREQGNFNLT
jgi:hypothetical protein